MTIQVTPEQFIALMAAILAILFEWLPSLKKWWDTLTPDRKRLYMIGMLVLLVGVTFGLSCAGLTDAFTCTVMGAIDALILLMQAIAINQGVHLLTKHYQWKHL